MFGAWLFEWLVLLEYRFTSRYVKAGTMREEQHQQKEGYASISP
jgi:hypothetical protein